MVLPAFLLSWRRVSKTRPSSPQGVHRDSMFSSPTPTPAALQALAEIKSHIPTDPPLSNPAFHATIPQCVWIGVQALGATSGS